MTAVPDEYLAADDLLRPREVADLFGVRTSPQPERLQPRAAIVLRASHHLTTSISRRIYRPTVKRF